MLHSEASGKKPIKKVEYPRARKSKLERLSNRGLTRHKNASEELDKARTEWEMTFNTARDSITIIDSEFKIVQANCATSRLFGKPLDEIVGKTCWQVVHGTERPPKECPLKKTLYTKDHEQAKLYVPEKDIWIEVSTDPIQDALYRKNATLSRMFSSSKGFVI